jgi:5-hydroxyisourate hydrolase
VTTISTHVLDTAAGRPAAGVRIELWAGLDLVADGATDDDGRIGRLAEVEQGTYRLVFFPLTVFIRRVELEVVIEADGHYHIPLLVSPYGCATYRGS